VSSSVARKRRAIKRRFLDVLRSQLGYVEGRNNDTKYGRWYGLNFQPWCAMYLSWCAAKAGLTRVIPRHAYTPAGAAWFKDRHQWGDKPRVGAVAFYDVSGLGRISHVGVVEKVLPGGRWYSLEGNTNAAGGREGRVVRRQIRSTTGKRGGFGYPDYTAQARRELS
jgi:hypothetical protein